MNASMNRRSVFLGVALAAVAVGGLLACGLPGCAGPTGSVPRGSSMFPLSINAPTVQGERFMLGQHEGRVVVVCFFKTSCPWCLQEMGHLKDLYRQKHDQGVDIVMVTTESAAKAREYAQSHALPFPVLPDAADAFRQVPHLTGVPTTLVLDRQGHVRYRIEGARSEQIDAAVADLLAEKP